LRATLTILLLVAASPAYAKAQTDLLYRFDEVYSTAVRFVRVDRGCKVTDQDQAAAFVMFECPLEDKKVSRGAIEIFRATQRGKEGVRIQVSLPDDTHGMELRFVELIERKLREERGTPTPPTPPPPPKAEPPDAGTSK
jgi:hypothetical protein